MKKLLLKERFQQLAGIKPLYELNEQQEQQLQVTAADGTVAIIPDPRDIGDFLTGKGIIYGETQDGGVIELHIDSALDYQYITNGDIGNDEIRTTLQDLTFDVLTQTFPKEYSGEYSKGVTMPNLDDSQMSISSESHLEDYKNKIERRFGNVDIVLKPNTKNWFDKIFIDNEKFNQERDNMIKGKMSAMQRDDERGWSTD